jgi:hypothetical protein
MNKKRPLIINFFALTLITVIVWVVYSLYVALTKPTDITVPPQALENFDTRLDAEALTKLQQSIYLTENELVESASVVVIPTIEETEQEEEEIDEELLSEEELQEEEIPANESVQP